MNTFEITILYDNICTKLGFKSGFGFSALIKNKKTNSYILFDTGTNGKILLHNLKRLNVNLNQINKIIISHAHNDHAGGLKEIYSRNESLHIFVPNKTKKLFRNKYSNAHIIGISNLTKIEENIYSSGEFGNFIREQALFLKTEQRKIIILVGCTHPGLENFIIKARELGKIKAIIGGFHGFKKFSYFEDIDLIGACHCTSYRKKIKRRFPEQFYEVCVGSSFKF